MIIRKSRKKAALITGTGFLLGIAGGLFLQYADAPVVGWCFMLAAVFTLILGFGTLSDRKPYIILTEAGITELSTLREQIEWEAILHVDDFFFRGQSFVRMLLDRDYKPEMVRPGWFWRFDRIYGQAGVRAVYVRTTGLEIDSMQLASLVERMRRADLTTRIELLERFGSV